MFRYRRLVGAEPGAYVISSLVPSLNRVPLSVNASSHPSLS
jgi:hypothetical protein